MKGIASQSYWTQSFGLSAFLHMCMAAIMVVSSLWLVEHPVVPSVEKPFTILPSTDPSSRSPAVLTAHENNIVQLPAIKAPRPQPQARIDQASAAPTVLHEAPIQPARPNILPRMTIDEFRRLHGLTVSPRPNTSRVSPHPVAHVQVQSLKTDNTGIDSTMESNGPDVKASFIARLLRDLKSACPDTSRTGNQLSAKIEFSLKADGSLLNPSIVVSSGNTEFDQLVLQAFIQTKAFGFPVAAIGQHYRVTFRTTDGN